MRRATLATFDMVMHKVDDTCNKKICKVVIATLEVQGGNYKEHNELRKCKLGSVR